MQAPARRSQKHFILSNYFYKLTFDTDVIGHYEIGWARGVQRKQIERIVKHARRQPSPLSTVDLWHIGGAVRRVGAEESAFYGREAAFLLSPEANREKMEDDEVNVAWLREFIADMQAFSDGSACTIFRI